MRVVLCCIAKNEHLYINEWVKHYIDLGIDNIYLYDNDDVNSPYIKDYIDKEYKDKVDIFNIRGIKLPYLQHYIYNVFYSKYKHTFEWCLFCDIDEFLVGVDNIKEIVSNKNCEQIRIKWKLFGDDNKIFRNINESIIDFFKEERHDGRLEYQGKSLVRGCLNIKINSCHYVKGLNSCYPSGKKCQSNDLMLKDYDNETVYMNHYMTKTLSEFIKQKFGRGDAVWNKRTINLDYFWQINEKTEEKLNYLKNMGL